MSNLTTFVTKPTRFEDTRSGETGRRQSDIRFDWAIVVLSAWMIGGVHLDAWAHHRFSVETFFTPWHGVLYAGFAAVAAVLAVTFVRNLRRGDAWRQALPVGYGLSLLGVVLFAAGGIGDLLWHILFGIEVNIEALLSPTHLLLALGGGLISTGPLRAAWARADAAGRTWSALLPALLSLALLLSMLSLFAAYANPLSEGNVAQGSRPIGEGQVFLTQAIGVAGILVQTALMMGVMLLAVRRWALPFGSLTLVLALSALLTVSIHEYFYLLPFAVLSGLAADLLLQWLRPSAAHPGAFRLFAFAVPVVFYTLYFATLALTSGVWWTVHLWAGAIVMAGVVGWLLSYAFIRPPATAERLSAAASRPNAKFE